MAQVAIEHDLLVVCDETYEYFMYGEQRHVTLATFPGMWERTLTSYTFTKAYAMSGWRLGCIVGPKQLLEPLRKVHEHTASFVSPFVQAAGIAALDGPQNHIEGWRLSCETLRSVVAARLNSVPGLDCAVPQGATFVFPRYSANCTSAELSPSKGRLNRVQDENCCPARVVRQVRLTSRLSTFGRSSPRTNTSVSTKLNALTYSRSYL